MVARRLVWTPDGRRSGSISFTVPSDRLALLLCLREARSRWCPALGATTGTAHSRRLVDTSLHQEQWHRLRDPLQGGILERLESVRAAVCGVDDRSVVRR